MEFFMVGAGICFAGIGLGAFFLFTAIALHVYRESRKK